MKKTGKRMAVLCAAVFIGTVSGCTQEKEQGQPTPTPVPTVTLVPATSTPMPTPTPTKALKRIGEKKEGASLINLNNDTGMELRGIYIKPSGDEEWGRNLIPLEASVEKEEQVQMYYMPVSTKEETIYDLKVVTDKAEGYEWYEVELEDMESATLRMEEDGTLHLRYRSLSKKKEVTLSSQDWEDSESQEEDFSQDDGYDWENQEDDVENPYENDWNGGYEDSDDVPDEDEDSGAEDDSSDSEQEIPGNGSEEDGSGGDSQGQDGSTDQGGSGTGEQDSSGDDDLIWDENGNWVEG